MPSSPLRSYSTILKLHVHKNCTILKLHIYCTILKLHIYCTILKLHVHKKNKKRVRKIVTHTIPHALWTYGWCAMS